jgi:hypothetical protein
MALWLLSCSRALRILDSSNALNRKILHFGFLMTFSSNLSKSDDMYVIRVSSKCVMITHLSFSCDGDGNEYC